MDASGSLATGAYYDPIWNYGPVLGSSLLYAFSRQVNLGPIPDLLSSGQAQWTFNYPFGTNDGYPRDLSIIGVHGSSQTTFSMDTGVSNGLDCRTCQPSWPTAPVGVSGSIPFTPAAASPAIWPTSTRPPELFVLSTIDYYFCRRSMYFPQPDGSSDPFPGQPVFPPPTQPRLTIASVGQSFSVAGYAKQLILNGDQSKFAYLGQYFLTKPIKPTAPVRLPPTRTASFPDNGEFLPTEPGIAILTTKPDLTQTNNVPGQCPVNVISLALDVNHDGTMDLSFSGPDTTSQARPYVFWCNNNFDRWATTELFGEFIRILSRTTSKLHHSRIATTPITMAIALSPARATWRITPGSGFAASPPICSPRCPQAARSA